MNSDTFWLVLGFTAQAMFTMRFLVQWIASERRKESVVPVSFWYFSIVGSLMLLTYAIYRKDPVFILGQSAGSIVYFRNLYLISMKRKRDESGVVKAAEIAKDAEMTVEEK